MFHERSLGVAGVVIEAEKDEMCPPGQTEAAHDVCTGDPEERRRHHLQPGVGHHGIFSGRDFGARNRRSRVGEVEALWDKFRKVRVLFGA